MSRGRTIQRVSSPPGTIDDNLIGETRAGYVPTLILPPAVVAILLLADRVASRYLAGKHGLALEHDAQAIKEAMDTLPDAIRLLL